MTTITPELIADVKKKGGSAKEIEVLNNQLKEQEDNAGKTNGGANQGVGATSINATPGSTELESEDTSSESPQLVIDIGEETLTLEQVKKLAGETPISTYIKENNGKVRHDKEHTLPEVKVTPTYEITNSRADELFEEEVGNILNKVHEGTSTFEINTKKKTKEFGGETEVDENDQYLIDHVTSPLTGLVDVKDPNNQYGPAIGVKRKAINLQGNQALTSVELKAIATKIWDQLEKEDDYLGGVKEGGFNFKTLEKTKKELSDWALEYKNSMDSTDPFAMEKFNTAYRLKMNEVWMREAALDEEYQYRSSIIENIMNDKFRSMIINKGIEEEKSDLVPDNWQNAGTIPSALYEFAKYTIPNFFYNDKVVVNGESIYKLSENLKEGKREGWKDNTVGYLGKSGKRGELVFRVKRPGGLHPAGGMVQSKKMTWAEAQVILNAEIDKYGYMVMENLAKSREYQEKLNILGAPELLDEEWNWNLDGEGYKKLLGTQLGQMALGTLSFGGSTFMQELGQMSQRLILEKSVMMMEGIPLKVKNENGELVDSDFKNFSEKEVEHLMKKFGNLDIDKQNDLALQVLKGGHIPFDELYASAARSGGLDLVGNWFVIAKGAKLVPKQLVTGFMTKNLSMFFKGAGSLLARVGSGTLAEMLTEGLQATNSERTVSRNSPLSTMNSHAIINEALMAAVVPGPVMIAGMTTQSLINDMRTNHFDTSEANYKAWFDVAKKKIDTSNLTNAEKTVEYEKIWRAEEIISNTNLKDVKTPGQRGRVIVTLLDSQKHQTRINELQAEIAKRTKENKSAKTTDLDKEIAKLEEKLERNTKVVIQEKAIDHFMVNAERQAEWQNRQSEGLNKNRFTKIFKTQKEAKEYLLKNYPERYGEFKNMLEGGYGANMPIMDENGNVIGAYNFAIEEHVIAGIRESNDLTAGNVINHEQAHDNLSTFSPEELSNIRIDVMQEMEASTDPQIQRALVIMRAKLKTYTKPSHEEFFTAMSDAFHYLNMENISIEGSTTLSFLGEIFSTSFDKNIGPIVNWQEGFSEMGVVDFIKSYTRGETRVETKDPIAEIRDGKEPGIFDEDVKKGSNGIYVQDSRRVYPEGRTSEEIKQANSILAEEIRNEKTNPSYTNEANPALEAKIREDQLKKLNGELIANNMGLINMFLKHKSNGGLYFDPKAGDVNYDDFSEAVMGEVGVIINSYDETKGDFGMYLGSLMNKRIPGIWDNLINQKEFSPDPDSQPVPDEGGYDSMMNDFEDEIITFGGKEITKKAATSEMRKRLGIKTGDPMYNEILDEVIDITIQNYDAINEEGFYQDTKERFQKALFTKIKKSLGSPKSEKFITWLNDNVEDIYNLLPQSIFNKSYDHYNDIGGRANVIQSEDKDVEYAKGVKIKSKTAGNRLATKMPFTDEIGRQFIKDILNPPEGQGRPASKQDALVNQLIEVIAFDAVGTAMESKAFRDAHGDQQAVMGVVADKINRDMTVQFSNKTTGIKYELKTHDDLQNANRLIRSAELVGITDPKQLENYIRTVGKNNKLKQDVIEFVVHLDSNEIIEIGDAVRFKIDLIAYLEKTNPKLAAELKEDGAIKGNKYVLDKMAEEITSFTGTLDSELLDAVGFDIFAFHRRALNAAATQQGPQRGDGSTVQKYNAKNPDGNRSYANKNTTLLLEGWTFDPNTNKFFHNKGKYAPNEDPVKNHGAMPTAAPYFQTLQDIKAANELKKADPNYSPAGKYDDVRIMNVDYPGGLFKKIGKILDGPGTRQEKIDKIVNDHGAEIEAANRANTKLATDISTELIEAVRDGKMSEKTLMHILQSQTNLAFGFRGLTKLSMISVLEGSYKDANARVYGEHINPNSSKMLELAKIALRAKNDPEYNYKEAVAELFADHEQLLFPSTDAKTIDTSKLLTGPTSTASYDRLKALTLSQRKNFIGINGESYNQALANANARKNIEIETARKDFESQRALEIQNQKNRNIVTQDSLNTDFNKIIETKTGIGAEKVYSKAQSEIQGASAGNIVEDLIFPPSAYDFEMFTYKYMTKGKEGEVQGEWFKKHLFIPYEEAMSAIDTQRQEIRKDYSALVKQLPQVEKSLNEKIEGTNFSSEQAIRVSIWTDMGVDMQKLGLSKRDQKALVAAVKADPELSMFADRLKAIGRQRDGYVKPTEYWTVESIAFDLEDMTGSEGRARYLALWKKNKDQIFSEANMNKIGRIYGPKHREALEDMLYRMEYGRNKNKPGRIEREWNNWVNNSVGAVMFFNMRSAALQTISAVNYIDWENNHPGNAALAFADQPQFWKDFKMIFQSDFLRERRGGSKRTINEAELAKHVAGKSNKYKAALAWMLEKGFLPTQLADSFAIAAGGASFYRNQVKAYEKQGMSTKEAEAQAFLDFRDKTNKGQQSSRADLISQQQAGGLGRLILAFKNTPMQYTRIMIKAMSDIKNKRGSLKANLSKIAYYGAAQNLIFNSLQTALFSAIGDDDEWDNKTERVAHGVIDSVLNGLGLTGAVAVTVKNGFLRYRKEKDRGFKADHTRTIIQFANLSPTIGSKLRKLYSGIQTEAMNEGAIKKMGLTLENPAFASLANVISATTNIPADRGVNNINNIILASSSETEAMDRIALLMGWNAWDLGIKRTKAKEANLEFKKEKRQQKKTFDFNKRNDYNKAKEKENIEKQKQEKKEGKKVTCSYNTSKGRCGMAVVEGGTRCTIHQEVEQRKDGKKVQCKKIKNNKKQCGVMTTNKSGYCYYHD